MAWPGPLQYDNAEKHMEEQHPVKWSEYKTFETHEECEQVFVDEVDAPFANTIHAHFSSVSVGDPALVFDVDASIFDDVIGEMLYGKDDNINSEEEQVDAEDVHADLDALACER